LNKEKIDRFLQLYNKFLLWAFVISMSVVALVYMLNIDAFTYEVNYYDNMMQETGYQLLEVNEYNVMKQRFNRLAIIGVICIVGMIAFNPDVWAKIKRINNKEV
jgi:hypothetical protein